jgi:chitin disaccharide deacetylase
VLLKKQTTKLSARHVVFHADDLGLNQSVTDGILRGFTHGLLTSASLLANAPDAVRALVLWKQLLLDQASNNLPSGRLRRVLGDPQRPFDLGIHLNLTQGRPLTGDRYPAILLDKEGCFPGVFTVFYRIGRHWPRVRGAVWNELCSQMEVLLVHGLRPTHLNGHQYVEIIPAVAEIIPQLLHRYAIPVVRAAVEPSLFQTALLHERSARNWLLGKIKRGYARSFCARMDSLAIAHPDWFFGTAHAGRIDMQLMRLFLGSRRAFRLAEIGLHPGNCPNFRVNENGTVPFDTTGEIEGWHDPLALSRPKELDMLLSTELSDFLHAENIQLGRLSDLGMENIKEDNNCNPPHFLLSKLLRFRSRLLNSSLIRH